MKQRNWSPRQSAQGFTLVELMVSLLIFAILSAGAIALLSYSVRAQATTRDHLDRNGAWWRTTSLLEADFAQALPRRARDERGGQAPAMDGASDHVSLVRGGWDNPDGEARPSVQKVAYQLVGDTLERVSYPQVDGAAPQPPARLLAGLTRIAIRYSSHGAWSDSWAGSPAAPLPDAVEWQFTRRDGAIVRDTYLVGPGAAPTRAVPQ